MEMKARARIHVRRSLAGLLVVPSVTRAQQQEAVEYALAAVVQLDVEQRL